MLHLAVLLALLPTAAESAAPIADTRIDAVRAAQLLFAADPDAPLWAACSARATDAERISCMVDVRYVGDKKAARIARELYERGGHVAGLLPAQSFDGDYRGVLQLVPHLPIKSARTHLEWLAHGLHDIDGFFVAHSPPAGAAPMRYRWRDLELLFFRSVKRKTPSAFATGWTVAYNVSGSLFTSKARVRETLFHEVFHLNDADHDGWSKRVLQPVYDRIVAKCGVGLKCLAPYAPDSIIVRTKGGTYYAFMPDNGVIEYAADVAKRWYVEHEALWKKKKIGTPFKCKTPENAEAWKLVVDEFFGGVDRTPTCK